MNPRKSARLIPVLMLAVFMAAGPLVGSVSAQGIGMSLNVFAEAGSTALTVSGMTTNRALGDVSITVQAPNGNIVGIDQKAPDRDGNYRTEVQLGDGILGIQDGVYTIRAYQSDANLYDLNVRVMITGGVLGNIDETTSSLDLSSATTVRPDNRISGLSFTVDAPEGALEMGINGNTDHLHTDVTMVVTAPNGNLIHTDQLSPDASGDFEATINVGCPNWAQDGMYTITIQQEENILYKDVHQVEIRDCVVIPEFGTVAVLVLAVAIVSIIAVTARSGLSIIPRY
ncbi:conserved hypothetical protein [Cenarchaeum symbiosum A]|uniref:PEFG-CTERM sorting domain-containing protein n=1 Tax=Cenarchaeum symbiosum (strain A) TaxID=414004 RepID=A0RUQ7_CENSY|nr:conserved hypothetical protein [Cenarchaeum symbiosum A]